MAYPALPDRRIPYDNDGTLVYWGTMTAGATTLMTGGEAIEAQDNDYVQVGPNVPENSNTVVFFFFPHQNEVTATYAYGINGLTQIHALVVTGSNDTTNGLDGTWETASLPAGTPAKANDFAWRSDIKAISFTGPKKNVRLSKTTSFDGASRWTTLHLYGEAAAGQMAHDLLFLNQDDTPGVAFTAPEDFGDQPLGSTVVRQFRIKNTSASRTANTVNIQCNDADFAIAENPAGPWVVTINIASLGPGVESATLYVRCTTPAPGAALGPRNPARIVVTCDPGFFG